MRSECHLRIMKVATRTYQGARTMQCATCNVCAVCGRQPQRILQPACEAMSTMATVGLAGTVQLPARVAYISTARGSTPYTTHPHTSSCSFARVLRLRCSHHHRVSRILPRLESRGVRIRQPLHQIIRLLLECVWCDRIVPVQNRLIAAHTHRLMAAPRQRSVNS